MSGATITGAGTGARDGGAAGADGGRPAPKTVVATGLCRAVLRGELEEGKRLVEMELAERFGVSRTPVREALLELEGLGVVELRRNCGAVACAFGPREVREIYEVRSILEGEAARLAADRMKKADLEKLRAAFADLAKRGATDEDWVLDRDLHGAIATSSGNRRLAGEIGRYGDLVQAVRETVASQLNEIHAVTLKEHLAILDALIAGDAEKAGAAMRAHVHQAAESAVEAVEKFRS